MHHEVAAGESCRSNHWSRSRLDWRQCERDVSSASRIGSIYSFRALSPATSGNGNISYSPTAILSVSIQFFRPIALLFGRQRSAQRDREFSHSNMKRRCSVKKSDVFRTRRARRAMAAVLSAVVCVLIAVPTAANEDWPALSESAWLEMTVSEVQDLLESHRVDARDRSRCPQPPG